MVASITVDASGPISKFRKINKWIRGEIPRLTKQQALRGARFARQIAPRDTTALVQAIDMAPGKKGQGKTEYLVISRQPNHPLQGRSRPYHMWLNEGLRGWAVGYPKSGEHRYMEATARYLRKEYVPTLKRELQKTLK